MFAGNYALSLEDRLSAKNYLDSLSSSSLIYSVTYFNMDSVDIQPLNFNPALLYFILFAQIALILPLGIQLVAPVEFCVPLTYPTIVGLFLTLPNWKDKMLHLIHS